MELLNSRFIFLPDPHKLPDVLSTHTPALLDAAVHAAAAVLRAGDVVVVPTETVYGLAANAWDPRAVEKIYEIKGRPPHNPIIVHVVGRALAEACVSFWPEVATRLAAEFWPGPLTLVLPKSDRVPSIVTAGGTTVGLRWPQHPFMQRLIRTCDFPLAAPSANLSNQLSPTQVQHARSSLGKRVRCYVDGGDCNVGIESTVLDLTQSPPVVLRPGIIDTNRLARILGAQPESLRTSTGSPIREPNVGIASSASPLRSPGLLSRHYAPRAHLQVLSWRDEQDLLAQLSRRIGAGFNREKTWILAHSKIPLQGAFPHVMLIPDDPEAYARALYAQLHQADTGGAERIIVEAVPDTAEWAGVADRLRRAAK